MRWNLCLCFCCMWFSSAVFAQEAQSPGVSGEGSITLERPASRMRMTIVLTEKGPSVKEALAKLSERREAAAIQLQTLKAEKESITFTRSALAADDNNQRRQMEAMIQERLARGASVPKGLQLPKSATVQCTLTAEWPLSKETDEELLIQTKELQDKVAEADLAGLKEAKKLSPEEAELEEELAAMSSGGYYEESEAKPGEPQFLYLARISEAELDKALEEAFGKAKAQAERLARAAGLKLGELATLRRIDSPYDVYDEYSYYASPYRSMPPTAVADETESHSPKPESVKFQFRVEATFQMSKE
jgi:hypothetical protein